MKVTLFKKNGEVVDQIVVGNPNPGIVVYKGLFFRLENGRYVESTVWHHQG